MWVVTEFKKVNNLITSPGGCELLSPHQITFPQTVKIIVSFYLCKYWTLFLTFSYSMDMRRGSATQSEGQAVWVVWDLHNPGSKKTSQTSALYVSVRVYICLCCAACVFSYSLALVATSSRRERRRQKAWLIMVSTSAKGLRNSRSSLMV